MEQTATPKKRVVFDDSVYDEDLLRELLEDRYVSNGDMQELNDDFVNENWYQLDEYRQQDYEDEIAALTAYFDGESSTMSSVVAEHGGNPLIVTGSVGRWDGIHTGFTVFKDFGDLMEGPDTPFKDCEIQKVWDENGHLFIHGAHHDGSVTIEVKQLSDVGAEAYEAISEAWVDEPFTANGKTYDGSERSVIDALGDLWHATKPPLYMERAFGCPAEEWEQPLSDVHKGFDPGLPTTEYGQFPFDGLSAEQYLDVAAGDLSSDYDLHAASVDLVDAVNEILRPHGVITTVSGIAYCNSGVGPDLAPHELSQLVHDSVDVYQILENHDVSEHAEPSASLKGEAVSLNGVVQESRAASTALEQNGPGHGPEPSR